MSQSFLSYIDGLYFNTYLALHVHIQNFLNEPLFYNIVGSCEISQELLLLLAIHFIKLNF